MLLVCLIIRGSTQGWSIRTRLILVSRLNALDLGSGGGVISIPTRSEKGGGLIQGGASNLCLGQFDSVHSLCSADGG